MIHLTNLGTPVQMHGATYTVDAEFKTDALVEKSNWVVDIGAASEMLAAVLSKYNFKNLNEIFPGQNTTTEFMCKVGGSIEHRAAASVNLSPGRMFVGIAIDGGGLAVHVLLHL